MRRQHIDQRAEAQALGALRNRGQEDARRWRQIERRGMMLAHVIGAETCAVVEFDQPKALLILLSEWIRAVIVLIEDAELHGSPTSCYRPQRPSRRRRFARPSFCDSIVNLANALQSRRRGWRCASDRV
jgi:hypothetical protein